LFCSSGNRKSGQRGCLGGRRNRKEKQKRRKQCNLTDSVNLRYSVVLHDIQGYLHALEYSIRKLQELQVGLKLNGTHQSLAYADDVNLLGDIIVTIKKNTETLIDAGKGGRSRSKSIEN
jgi:hypothetical protein